MSGVAVFVGAGASCHFGVPPANQLASSIVRDVVFQKEQRLLHDLRDVYGDPLRDVLRRFLLHAYPAIGRYWEDQPTVTDILSVIDYSLATETALPFDGTDGSIFDMHEVRRALEHCIIELIDRTSEIVTKSHDDSLRRISNAVAEWSETNTVTLISTNYDTIFDRCWYTMEFEHEYDDCPVPDTDLGTPFRTRFGTSGNLVTRNTTARKRLYKLHGSLNWLKCPACEHLYVAPVQECLSQFAEQTYGILELNDCHCGHAPLRPLIVSPSYVRDVRDTSIREIWRSAQEALRLSDVWIFAGYSLPAEDVAIRSLINRAHMSVSDVRSRRTVHVYDISKPAANAAYSVVDARYRTFLENTNTVVRYHGNGMEQFMQDVDAFRRNGAVTKRIQ